MSSFNCEHCGTAILDGENGYVTECEHHPIEIMVSIPREFAEAINSEFWNIA